MDGGREGTSARMGIPQWYKEGYRQRRSVKERYRQWCSVKERYRQRHGVLVKTVMLR